MADFLCSLLYKSPWSPRSPVGNEGIDGSVGHRILVQSFVIRHTFVFKSVAPEYLGRHVGGPNLEYISLIFHQTPASRLSTSWRKNMCFRISPHKHKSWFLPSPGPPEPTWNKDTLGLKNDYSAIWIQFLWTLRKFYSWTCQNQLLESISFLFEACTRTVLECLDRKPITQIKNQEERDWMYWRPLYLDRVPGLRRGPFEGEHHLK